MLLEPIYERDFLDCSYLRERGLTAETIQRYGLGLCRRGVLKGYVAIPVYRWPRAAGENPVAYLGRWPGEIDQCWTSGSSTTCNLVCGSVPSSSAMRMIS